MRRRENLIKTYIKGVWFTFFTTHYPSSLYPCLSTPSTSFYLFFHLLSIPHSVDFLDFQSLKFQYVFQSIKFSHRSFSICYSPHFSVSLSPLSTLQLLFLLNALLLIFFSPRALHLSISSTSSTFSTSSTSTTFKHARPHKHVTSIEFIHSVIFQLPF